MATLQEFDEVMARYGLWQLARLEQVQVNLNKGVLPNEDTLAFDTTHAEAHSHCGQPASPVPPPQSAAIRAGVGAHGIIFAPDGKTSFVTNQGDNTVTFIDVASKGAVATVASPTF